MNFKFIVNASTRIARTVNINTKVDDNLEYKINLKSNFSFYAWKSFLYMTETKLAKGFDKTKNTLTLE